MRLWLVVMTVAVGCTAAVSPVPVPVPVPGASPGGTPPGGTADGGVSLEASTPAAPLGKGNLRVMAANTTSGNQSTYDPGEGIRMFQGLHPDIALIQELNYKTNSDDDLAEFTTTAFGDGFVLNRPTGLQIPNGIASRWPMTVSGSWEDPFVDNRSFTYAKIAVPGPHALWAVSVHLLTTKSSERASEAAALLADLQGVIAADDYVVVAGDFNTDGRSEGCITTLGAILHVAGPYPADQAGNDATNAPRGKTYDWVLGNEALAARQVPTVLGASELPNGLVFDSRLYTPLSDVTPVMVGDSAATNMQHMPVVKDFSLPE